jgi:hypothetical protein
VSESCRACRISGDVTVPVIEYHAELLRLLSMVAHQRTSGIRVRAQRLRSAAMRSQGSSVCRSNADCYCRCRYWRGGWAWSHR